MRTGLEPNKPLDIFSSTKPTTESNKSNDWLGLKYDSDEDDQSPPRGTQHISSVVTTLVKKNPIAPAQAPPPTIQEPPKKSVLDDLLEDDRRALTEKTPISSTTIHLIIQLKIFG